MAVLSVDLACRRWSDLGIVVLEHERSSPGGRPDPQPAASPDAGTSPDPGPIRCEIVSWAQLNGEPLTADTLAGRLNHLCGLRDIRVMMLDGPQAWKSSHNGLAYTRLSERQLNTPAKTGLPGLVKPGTYRTFAEFCIDVYDALARRGWRRLATREQPSASVERILAESYPFAAWQALGLKPLPSKRRAHVSDLAETYAALQTVTPFTVNRPPNHDQLQAIVSGLAGLALETRNPGAARIVGSPPRREEGHWREGFIVLPKAPGRSAGLRWLEWK